MDLAQGGDVDFRVNEGYARNYNTWRRKEEIQKYKDRYGEDVDEDESSSSESEDDDAEALTPRIEKDFLKTLSIIKSKDPRLYKQDIKFFKEEDSDQEGEEEQREEGNARKKRGKKSDQPMYLKDYERRIIMEREGKFTDDDDDDDDEDDDGDERAYSPTYVEEQQQLKDSFFSAVHDDSDGEATDLLTVKGRPQDQERFESTDTRDKSTDSSDMDGLRKFWTDPALDEGEQFLRDFIVNKGYMDKDTVGLRGFKVEDDDDDDDDNSGGLRRVDDHEEEENFSEEERLLEEQEDFERKYNFRFEEPDSEFIKRYPRTVGESVRRKDDKRAQKRLDKKSRQEEVKHNKQQELKHLKNLKKQEISERLERLKEVTGNESIGFDIDDLEGDFDPKEHDRLMQKVFSGEYDDEGEEVKPQFDDEEFANENWDEWTRDNEDPGYHGNDAGEGEEEDAYYDDTNFNMDADYVEGPGEGSGAGCSNLDLAEEMLGASKKKKKKMSMFAKALMRKKPIFNPDDKSFEEYIDEYYRLDYEDMIGDLPCRFKYRTVEDNDFGLTTEEILKAKEKELNQWASLKKTCQYRSEEEEKKDKEMFRKMGQNAAKKRRIFLSLLEEEEEEGNEEHNEEAPPHGNQPKKGGKQKGKSRRPQHQDDGSQPQRRLAPEEATVQQKQVQGGKATKEASERNSEAGDAKMGEESRKDEEKMETVEGRKDDRLGISDNGLPAPVSSTSMSGRDKRRERKRMMISKLKEIKSKRKVKRLQGPSKRRMGQSGVSDARLKAYGFNPQKHKYRMRHANMMKK